MSHPIDEENYGTEQGFEGDQFNEFANDNSEELDALLEDEDDYSDSDTEESGDKSSKAARSGKSSNRALIRKVAGKAEELAGANAKDKKLLQEILGASSTNVADLTVAVVLSTKSSLQVVADLKEIAEAKPMRAVMTATAIGKARQKPLWSLLVHLGKLTGTPNNSEAKAGLDLAEAIFELTKEQHEALDRALVLAKR